MRKVSSGSLFSIDPMGHTCAKRAFRSSCACAKSHPGLCFPLTRSIVSTDSVSGQRRPWSDCAFAQSDLGLHCLARLARRHVFPWCGLHNIWWHVWHISVQYYVQDNENLKWCLWKQRTHKGTKLKDSVLSSLFIHNCEVFEAAHATSPPPPRTRPNHPTTT